MNKTKKKVKGGANMQNISNRIVNLRRQITNKERQINTENLNENQKQQLKNNIEKLGKQMKDTSQNFEKTPEYQQVTQELKRIGYLKKQQVKHLDELKDKTKLDAVDEIIKRDRIIFQLQGEVKHLEKELRKSQKELKKLQTILDEIGSEPTPKKPKRTEHNTPGEISQTNENLMASVLKNLKTPNTEDFKKASQLKLRPDKRPALNLENKNEQ